MSRTMKDSGIPWIGEIPEGWRQSRMKNYFHLHGRIGWNGLRSEEFEEQSYAYLVTGQDFCSKNIDWNKCYQINKERYDEDEYIQLVEGDILVTKDGTIGKIAVVSNLDKPACLNSGIFVVKQYDPKQFNPGYLYWLLVSPLLKTFNEFLNLGGTTIIHLYQNVFERMPIVAPPLAEQHLIATFLDKKCSEIDSLIELQEQMIEELKAYKQSVITEAVTKGLNPDAPMRDSGIEWIGQIPEHWIYTKLKHLCSFHNGDRSKNYPCPDEFVDKGVPFYGADSLNDFIANVNYARFITEEKYNLMGGLKIIEGDILYTLRGSTIGKNAIVQQPNGTTASSLMGIRRKDALTNAMYLLYWLHSQNEYIQRDICINGATAPNLSAEDVKEFMLFLPPISEQQAIADYLDEKCADIDSLIQTKLSKIDSLKEYKKSVIYEYVTGKREV